MAVSEGEEQAAVPRRKRRSPDTIMALILDAASIEFEEKGYSGATTAAIARRANVTEAQIFRFFDTKMDLFRAAIFKPLNKHFTEFHGSSEEAGAGQGMSRELARDYINELQDFMGEHSRMLMSLIVAEAYEKSMIDGPADIEGLLAYFEQGTRLMKRHAGTNAKVAPELMVRVSFAAVLANVMFKDWLFPEGIATEEEIREAIVDFTIDGIRANHDD
ncbi:MAG: TetR/AcrR family transcriptional regulator [Novosphingobium sp.]|nr:TetR/AcrR family transcriptional regulator [Novosphingobium sp.]